MSMNKLFTIGSTHEQSTNHIPYSTDLRTTLVTKGTEIPKKNVSSCHRVIPFLRNPLHSSITITSPTVGPSDIHFNLIFMNCQAMLISVLFSHTQSLVPRPRPAFRRLQYGKLGRAWERGYTVIITGKRTYNIYIVHVHTSKLTFYILNTVWVLSGLS